MNTITIDETIDASLFICRAHRLRDGVLVGDVISSNPNDNLPSLSSEPVYVVVIPYQGDCYQTTHSYAVNDLAFPNDTITTPFYYKRMVDGISGNTEPTWSTVAGALCDDNGIANAWLCFDLQQPVVQAYMSLTPEGVVWDDGLTIFDTEVTVWSE